ncbi:4-diphosphocytidyl-2-C-methyl-D-erythritol kinase [Dissulfurispira thermophila]|uniref:4-diphosphocytidyl-2-C-methyl-D-erythritol kinase n=1 Tax=Dissulfurispira thermophila TaxID=2715679 RepID=A0A7G1H3R9_9BACT|nr:4-(cytidine 5'-diphospho)-2-C-methyl-D-erythritol kinase [Dissulfurispira thermophila]BCB96377.1 4-diphosphocytidyl-2-C-methyl-D-erythritol kinase [Dissulfurispira thermophila]
MFELMAPAKVNWSLYVLDKREDGYHNILSLMHCIGLYDTLTFEHSDTIELITNMNILPEHNLVYKAAKSLQSYAEIKDGARIVLKKDIPSGAGLGGGSSDAAYALIGLNKLWGLGLDKDELKEIGSSIGSDVPFFFNCPMAIVEGRGDILTPLEMDISYPLLLVKPAIPISTVWAYERLGAKGKAQETKTELTKTMDKFNNIQLIYKALKTGDVSLLKSSAHNDFEEVVMEKYPIIKDLRRKLLNAGASMAIMSGSGSTVFGLFEDREKATNAARQFSSHWNRVVETYISS